MTARLLTDGRSCRHCCIYDIGIGWVKDHVLKFDAEEVKVQLQRIYGAEDACIGGREQDGRIVWMDQECAHNPVSMPLFDDDPS